MDKSQKFANFKVGLTVLAGLVIFFIFIFLVGVEGNYFTSNYTLKIFLENVEGLNVGAQVTLGGLKVGSVDKMEFTKYKDKYGIDVTLRIFKEYKYQITDQTKATLSSYGLLGDKFINLSLGQPGERPLENNEYLPVVPLLTLEALSEKVQPVLDDFSGLMTNLREITDTILNGSSSIGRIIKDPTIARDLEKVLMNLRVFTAALSDENGSLGKLAFDRTLYNKIILLTDNLTSLSDSIKAGKGTFGKLLTDDALYNDIKSLTERMNRITKQAEGDTTIAGALINDRKLYNDFYSIITDLNDLIKDLKENPQKYLKISVF